MKLLALAFLMISSIAFAQSSHEVTPSPTDGTGVESEDKGAIAPATTEQKAKVEKPVKKAAAAQKHKAAKKPRKAKKIKKTKKTKKPTN